MLGVLTAFMAGAVLSSCSKEEPFFSASEDDYPVILNTNLQEAWEGVPPVLKTIPRTENFTFEVTVTPAHYTTVTWLIDGVQVAEGTSVDIPLLAGEYNLKILATTTKGLQTYRERRIVVTALDGDPVLANDAKSRWLTIGTAMTIECANVEEVSKVYVGTEEATNVSYANGKLTFDVPSMPEGEYQVTVETGGEKFGCGKFTVSNTKYVAPGVQEMVLWEGSQVINWGDANVRLTAEQLEGVEVGTTIYLKYSVPEADYHALRITTDWWDYDIVPQFDITDETPNPFGFEYTAEMQQKVQEEGALLIVGFGYELQQVYYETQAVSAETVLWEGDPVVINWGDSNVHLTADLLASVQPDATIRVYYESIDADYHAMRITSNWWEYDFVPQFDITEDTPMPYEFTFTAEHQQIAQQQEGMLIVGFGYKVTKVTVEN